MATRKRLAMKFIMMGDRNTGKTSIINQYVNKKFSSQDIPTNGTNWKIKEFSDGIVVDDKLVSIHIWDTVDTESDAFDACILVFDLTRNESFHNLKSLRDEFIRKNNEQCPFLVIGNKSDLENRQIQHKQVQKWCDDIGSLYTETSAKDNTNIEQAFFMLIQRCIEKKEDDEDDDSDDEIPVSQVQNSCREVTEIVQASIIDDVIEEYVFTCELIELEKIMISVFNTMTGVTYKTYIHKNETWFSENIHIFRGDFKNIFPLLNDSLINKNTLLPYEVVCDKDIIHIKIIYTDTLFPFELILDIPRHISKNGELDDRVNSLEYQVTKLKEMIISMKDSKK